MPAGNVFNFTVTLLRSSLFPLSGRSRMFWGGGGGLTENILAGKCHCKVVHTGIWNRGMEVLMHIFI